MTSPDTIPLPVPAHTLSVPTQITPKNAQSAKDAVRHALARIPPDTAAQLSCGDGPPSVLALQLCHAVMVAAQAGGIALRIPDPLCDVLNATQTAPQTAPQAGAAL